MEEVTAAVKDAWSRAMAMDEASIEYGDFHERFSLARADSARPRRQKPACEQVFQSPVLRANTAGNKRITSRATRQVKLNDRILVKNEGCGLANRLKTEMLNKRKYRGREEPRSYQRDSQVIHSVLHVNTAGT